MFHIQAHKFSQKLSQNARRTIHLSSYRATLNFNAEAESAVGKRGATLKLLHDFNCVHLLRFHPLHIQDLAQKLGYSVALDRAFWVASDKDYLRYTAHNSSSKGWKRTPLGHAWPSPVSFWYRQSPQWMMPGAQSPNGPPRVTLLNPSYETSGMVTLRLDMQGNLLFLRGVPPQVETGEPSRNLDWSLLFAEAGLDKTHLFPPARNGPRPIPSMSAPTGRVISLVAPTFSST